jgi:pimeloyl-ACP methyl ester carboxylesterase
MQNRTLSLTYDRIKFRISYKLRKSPGDLIFFIHGLGCAKENFDDVWDVDRLKKYSVMTFDLPGFGDSSKPDNFSFDLQDHASICAELLSAFPARNVHIVGHSMGGAIGLLLSDLIRQRLRSFINVEGNLTSYDASVSRKQSGVTFDEFKTMELPGLLLVTSLSRETGTRLWSKLIRKASARGFYLSSRSLADWSDKGILLTKFIGLNCKKIYVHGEKNSLLRVLTLLDGIPTKSIPDSGHFPMNDNPEKFYSFLADFITGERS